MSMGSIRSLGLLAAVALAASPALAQTATQIGRHGDWTLHAGDTAGSKVCFVTTEPKESLPKEAKRGSVLVYISAFPKEGVRTEVSVKLGYPVRKGAPVTVTIGTTAFQLYAHLDSGFVADPTQELKLLDAMKKGSRLTVQATSERGTTTTDQFSLSGLSDALKQMASVCS